MSDQRRVDPDLKVVFDAADMLSTMFGRVEEYLAEKFRGVSGSVRLRSGRSLLWAKVGDRFGLFVRSETDEDARILSAALADRIDAVSRLTELEMVLGQSRTRLAGELQDALAHVESWLEERGRLGDGE